MKNRKHGHSEHPRDGWLVLARRANEGIALEGPEGASERASITLLRTDPLTIQLSLPHVGDVDLAIDQHGKLVRFGVRADRSIHVARAELDSQEPKRRGPAAVASS
jgi:sRNA-binding carbon storage regulator CsrA